MKTSLYFQYPQGYFWKWTDKVIEWDGHGRKTICFQEELFTILRVLSNQGLPPFGAVLLVLSASQVRAGEPETDWNHLLGLFVKKVKERLADPSDQILEYYTQQVSKLLNMVSSLPEELRTGKKKAHLIYEIFSGTSPEIPASQSVSLIDEMMSGRVEDYNNVIKSERKRVKEDLLLLTQVLNKYKSTAELEMKVRTGIPELPVPAELELPESPDLLEELAQDSKTLGISRLTKCLMAAFTIPMHSENASDQSFGGVSDISNRGNFDRLLLSELAYDDLLLMARLANNEALYLRREEPPDQINRQRIILLDSTIRMWGVPRVFAISAALACTRQVKFEISFQAVSLGGKSCDEIDLGTKAGVIGALECLDPALHCGNALKKYMGKEALEENEYILISDEQILHDPGFQRVAGELKKSLNFLLTVSRSGELHFYEFVQGRSKHLSSAKFDLEDLLFSGSVKRRLVKKLEVFPAFHETRPYPLFFPTPSVRVAEERIFHTHHDWVVGISDNSRLLLWIKREFGAIEVLETIEQGKYYFGSYENAVYVLVSNPEKNFLKIYTIRKYDQPAESIHLFDKVAVETIRDITFDANCFYLMVVGRTICLNGFKNWAEDSAMNSKSHTEVRNLFGRNSYLSTGTLKRYINNGYSVLQRVKKMYINQAGEFVVDSHHLKVIDDSKIRLQENGRLRDQKGEEKLETEEFYLEGSSVRFSRVSWEDGSEAIADSRGLLHLRSSDPSLPEVSIVLVIGKPTACWASDGMYCGSPYFTRNDTSKVIKTNDFYKIYIQAFIDKLP